MSDDMIKRLRDMMYRVSRNDAEKLGEIIAALDASTLAMSEANAALEDANARIAELESERDALLAAAGKEAVGEIAHDEVNGFHFAPSVHWLQIGIGTKLYTVPTAAPEKGHGRDAWISVDERLPDEDSVVLVSAWEYGKLDGKRFTLVARRSGSLFLNEETGDDLYTPTHWQPLPAPPAALSQQKANP